MTTNFEITRGCKIPMISHANAQEPVLINPSVWTAYPEIKSVVPKPPAFISRNDLKDAAVSAFKLNDLSELPRLCVKTMMWGSGTTNGRGPRYTASALRRSDIAQLMKKIYNDLADGRIEDAYRIHKKIPGVGPSFHTKLLWVIGSAIENKALTPLILDDRVWASLKRIGWNSRRSAGSRDRGKRYRA